MGMLVVPRASSLSPLLSLRNGGWEEDRSVGQLVNTWKINQDLKVETENLRRKWTKIVFALIIFRIRSIIHSFVLFCVSL